MRRKIGIIFLTWCALHVVTLAAIAFGLYQPTNNDAAAVSFIVAALLGIIGGALTAD